MCYSSNQECTEEMRLSGLTRDLPVLSDSGGKMHKNRLGTQSLSAGLLWLLLEPPTDDP